MRQIKIANAILERQQTDEGEERETHETKLREIK